MLTRMIVKVLSEWFSIEMRVTDERWLMAICLAPKMLVRYPP